MARKPGQTFSAGRVLSKLFVISGFIMKCESELGLCYPYFCFCFNMLRLFICVRLYHSKHVAVSQRTAVEVAVLLPSCEQKGLTWLSGLAESAFTS